MKAFVAFASAVLIALFVSAITTFAAGDLSGDRFAQMFVGTPQDDPAPLVGQLNQFFEHEGFQSGGQSEGQFVIPENVIYWGDASSIRLPDDQFFPLRVRDGIGVYLTYVPVQVPSGRFVRTDLSLCQHMADFWGFCQQDGSTSVTPAPQAAPVVSSGSGGYPSHQICPAVRAASNPGQAIDLLNQVAEGDGYFYYHDFKSGDIIPAGSVFWTNFNGRPWSPDDFKPLKNSGTWGAFYAVSNLVANSDGRYLQVAGSC